jgi:hypothetical protein
MSGFSIIPCITGTLSNSLSSTFCQLLVWIDIALTLRFLCFICHISNSIFRTYRPVYGLPFASTCSLALSANCHPPAQDKEAYLLPVQWGIYEKDDGSGAKCAFTTSRHVRSSKSHCKLWALPIIPKDKRSYRTALRGFFDKSIARL